MQRCFSKWHLHLYFTHAPIMVGFHFKVRNTIPDHTVCLCSSCDLWWNVNDIVSSHAPFRTTSTNPLLSDAWCHWDKFEFVSLPSGGGRTWMLLTHLLHLNLQRKSFKHIYIIIICYIACPWTSMNIWKYLHSPNFFLNIEIKLIFSAWNKYI